MPGREIVEQLMCNCCKILGVAYCEVGLFLRAGCKAGSGVMLPVPGRDVAGCWASRFGVAGASFDPTAEYALGKEHGGNSSALYGSGMGVRRASCGGAAGVILGPGVVECVRDGAVPCYSLECVADIFL